MGARRPDIRKQVKQGYHFFVVSGRVAGAQQYVVGGFAIEQKITQLAAYTRFPENRQYVSPMGILSATSSCSKMASHNPIHYHTNFENRVDNYIIGQDPIVLETPEEIRRGRAETLTALKEIFHRESDNVFKVIGRGRRLNEDQVEQMRRWLSSIKNAS